MKMILAALVFLTGLASYAQSSDDAYVLSVRLPDYHGPRLDVYLPTDLNLPAQLSVVSFMEVVGSPDGDQGFSVIEIPQMSAQIQNVRPRIANPEVLSAGDGVKLNLGKSGKIAVRFTGNGNECIVKSTVREFDVPKATRVRDCALYFKPGVGLPQPSPGVTGSN